MASRSEVEKKPNFRASLVALGGAYRAGGPGALGPRLAALTRPWSATGALVARRLDGETPRPHPFVRPNAPQNHGPDVEEPTSFGSFCNWRVTKIC